MRLFGIITLLIGTQIGLSDGLILPVLVAKHGQSSFLLLYACLKILFILPILQAEMVAGRLHRATPLQLSFLIIDTTWIRTAFAILLSAIIFVIALNLFNSAWIINIAIDGLQGQLQLLKPLDQNLYWFQQNQQVDRIFSFVILQGILLILLGNLAWRGIQFIYAIWCLC